LLLAGAVVALVPVLAVVQVDSAQLQASFPVQE